MEIACAENTLIFDPELCVGCGTCSEVCPHGVFSEPEPFLTGSTLKRVQLIRAEACMECGACALNCLTGAIRVESGVGCASAMIRAALTGKEVSCDGSSCCGSPKSIESACCGSSSVQADAGCCANNQTTENCCSSSDNSSCCSEKTAQTGCCTSDAGSKTRGCC